VLDRHDVRPKKALGQNFVIDPNTIRKIVAVAAIDEGDRVVEIGAGAGSLTVALAGAAAHVVAIELDGRQLPVLEEVVGAAPNVEIVHGDALTMDLSTWEADLLIANLPYNVATPLIARILETAPGIRELTIMTQREVGERLAASPGSKIYGQISVVVAYFATARVAARVSRKAFYPKPNVDSVIVTIARRATPSVSYEAFKPLVRAAFAHRRKTLRNALEGFADANAVRSALEAAGLDGSERAEQLDLSAFERLAGALARL
jgi:16S rRNA (adenine1518-N6/adenine1519-N6)-dimethyltransferase